MLLTALQSVGLEIPCDAVGNACEECFKVINICSSSTDVLFQWGKLNEIYASSKCRGAKQFLRQTSGSMVDVRAC